MDNSKQESEEVSVRPLLFLPFRYTEDTPLNEQIGYIRIIRACQNVRILNLRRNYDTA